MTSRMTSVWLRRGKGGFLLLETMIGVMVFALGVLALAQCAERCIDAQGAKARDDLARGILENRMVEIEKGAEVLAAEKVEILKGRWTGMTLRESREPLRLLDERRRELKGLFRIGLEVSWKEPSGEQKKTLTFYVQERR